LSNAIRLLGFVNSHLKTGELSSARVSNAKSEGNTEIIVNDERFIHASAHVENITTFFKLLPPTFVWNQPLPY
jgi:hypothetical protein